MEKELCQEKSDMALKIVYVTIVTQKRLAAIKVLPYGGRMKDNQLTEEQLMNRISKLMSMAAENMVELEERMGIYRRSRAKTIPDRTPLTAAQQYELRALSSQVKRRGQ